MCENLLKKSQSPFFPQMVNKSAVYTFQQYLSLLYIASVKLELAAETRFATLALFRRFWECKGWSTAADSPPPPASAVCDPEGGEVGYFVAACVFLACKAEEQFRKLRDIVNVCHVIGILTIVDEDDRVEALPPNPTLEQILRLNSEPPLLTEAYTEAKADIVSAEGAVLRMLKFDVVASGSNNRPYRVLLMLVSQMDLEGRFSKKVEDEVVRAAWAIINGRVLRGGVLAEQAVKEILAACIPK